MERDTKYYNNLIIRYFSGEADPEEVVLLGTWVKADPENRLLFEDYKKTWEAIEQDRIGRNTDIEKDLGIVNRMIRQREQIGQLEQRTDDGYRLLPVNPEKPIRRYNPMPFLRVAAVLVVLLVPAWLIYRNFISPDNERITASLSVVESLLPDGTKVSLNAGSSLDYPEHFVKNERNVVLAGEGYFDVAHNASKPFVISSGQVRIKALGTEFNVNTRVTGDLMEVILTTGRVAIWFDDKPGIRVILEPGEKAALSVTHKTIVKSVNPDENYMSWKTRRINFVNQPLESVVATLNNVYHSSIVIKPGELRNCRLTATFDHQSLESVLHVLTTTLELTAGNNGTEIELSGKECN